MRSETRVSVVLAAVAVVVVGSAVAADRSQGTEEASYGGTVEAVRGAPLVPSFAGPADDADRSVRPDLPPLDQIPPMPMPDLTELPENAGQDRTMTIYDAATGKSTRLSDTEGKGEGSAFGGGYGGPFDRELGSVELSKGFGTMSQITTTGVDPWNKNVKLFMKYNTTSGGTAWYVCSGSMRDAEVVLAASHCVYSREADIMDWAAEIWVYPGWDGTGSWGTPADVETFGYAWGNYYQASNAWINSGDYTYDVALIKVERAVGMLTGWWSWAYGQACDSRSRYNVSYPSEDCGSPGLHTGTDMYFWSGTVDDCATTNRFHIITTPGCFTALWGGQSGSAVYYIDSGNRYVEAVASTSNRTTDGYYARLYEGFVNDMNNTFIPYARGATLDLQALRAVTDPTTIAAGASFTTSSFFTANPTNADPASTSYYFDLRLSTNNLLSGSDTLLADNWSYSWDYPAMGSVTVNTGAVTIPYNTPSGTYWFGALLDPATDGVSSNNTTSYWDAQQITVNGVADLLADYLLAPSGTFNNGASLGLSYNIDNLGGDPSNTVTVDIRASTNTVISTTDTQLGLYNLAGLAGNGTTTQSPTVVLPAGLVGTYYIGMIVTASDDVATANNTTYDATPIFVTGTIFANGFESGNTSAWSAAVP